MKDNAYKIGIAIILINFILLSAPTNIEFLDFYPYTYNALIEKKEIIMIEKALLLEEELRLETLHDKLQETNTLPRLKYPDIEDLDLTLHIPSILFVLEDTAKSISREQLNISLDFNNASQKRNNPLNLYSVEIELTGKYELISKYFAELDEIDYLEIDEISVTPAGVKARINFFFL